MNQKLLNKYADLLLRTGVNLQKNQKLIIESPVETYDFARLLAKKAYAMGSGEVIIHYTDALTEKETAKHLEAKDIARVENWEAESLDHYLREGAASILFASPDPFLMDDLEQDKAHAIQTHTNDKRNHIRAMIASDHTQWLIAAVPNQAWAEAVLKDEPKETVLDTFWELIFKLAYVDEEHDPNETWKEREQAKHERGLKLDALQLDHVRMTSSNGTDLVIGFHEDARFTNDPKEEGIVIHPNIPTEEICTCPDKWRVDGKVVSARPLLLGGKIVDDFELTFKEGKVVDCHAKTGEDLLRSTILTDEGSCYLGEFALVEYHSPISLSGKVFYNTLIDENASCHLSLGKGFPRCVRAHPTDLNDWEKKHLNFSKIHIDFMVGTPDTQIMGYTRDGREVPIFVNGDFAL